METINTQETRRAELEARATAHAAWVDTFRGRNGWASIPAECKPPAGAEMSNDERGELEILQFLQDKHARLFCYIDEKTMQATAWPGQSFGRVSLGHTYCSSFGDKRRSVTLFGVNGCTYHGTYYCGAGDYARLRIAKANRQS